MSKVIRFLKKMDCWFGRLESILLVAIGSALVGLSALRIGLRLFGTGMPWISPCLRSLVLWTAFVGGAKAVQRNASIRIDLFQRFFSGSLRRGLEILSSLCALILCVFMLWIACRFVIEERNFGEVAFWKVKTWHVEMAFPLGIALMAFHFGVRMLDRERMEA